VDAGERGIWSRSPPPAERKRECGDTRLPPKVPEERAKNHDPSRHRGRGRCSQQAAHSARLLFWLPKANPLHNHSLPGKRALAIYQVLTRKRAACRGGPRLANRGGPRRSQGPMSERGNSGPSPRPARMGRLRRKPARSVDKGERPLCRSFFGRPEGISKREERRGRPWVLLGDGRRRCACSADESVAIAPHLESPARSNRPMVSYLAAKIGIAMIAATTAFMIEMARKASTLVLARP